MEVTVGARLPFCSTVIRPSSTNSFAALFLVVGGIFVISDDSTMSPLIYLRLKASAKTIEASKWAPALAFRNTSIHHAGCLNHSTLNSLRSLFRSCLGVWHS